MNRLFKSITINNQYIKFRIPSLKSELYLIKWLPNSKTDIHIHDGKNCNFLLLKGSLTETRYLKNNEIKSNGNKPFQINSMNDEIREHEIKNNEIKSNEIKPFQINSMNDEIGEHEIKNNDDTIKWSLHRYS